VLLTACGGGEPQPQAQAKAAAKEPPRCQTEMKAQISFSIETIGASDEIFSVLLKDPNALTTAEVIDTKVATYRRELELEAALNECLGFEKYQWLPGLGEPYSD
jgi:hypothetical protein